MEYEKGLKVSLRSHFGAWFVRLEELLRLLPAALPHTTSTRWERTRETGVTRTYLKGGTGNKVLGVSIAYALEDEAKTTYLLRSELHKGRAFGIYERAFANSVTQQIGRVIDAMIRARWGDLLAAPDDVLDAGVADFLRQITGITGPDFRAIIRFLKDLAQQSYETKAISYGLLVSRRLESKENVAVFPSEVVDQKRFQAITDGFKTALALDRTGKVVSIVGLKEVSQLGEHFRPSWLDPLADSARAHNAIGIALTRTGAILVAWKGNLLLSYRLGHWILWYHSENVEIIRDGLTWQGPKPKDIGRLAARLYRCSLDVSFRRTGGLFVALRSPNRLAKLVRKPEQLHGVRRTAADRAVGQWLADNTVIGIDREVLVDLAALDGAIVCDRNGRLLSYGSVLLLPGRKGLGSIEGSRSRAAHSASFLGLSIKISSDGTIDVIQSGDKMLSL
jgi:hypothetical protein